MVFFAVAAIALLWPIRFVADYGRIPNTVLPDRGN